MNWVDIAIIVVAALGGIIGYKHGLIRSAFTVAGLILGITIAGHFSDGLADKLSPSGAQWASVVSFIVILLIVIVIANLMGAVVKTFLKIMLMGWLDAIGGIVLGAAAGALVVAAVFTTVLQWEASAGNIPVAGVPLTGAADAIRGSSLADFLIDKFRLVLSLLPDRFDSVTQYFTNSTNSTA